MQFRCVYINKNKNENRNKDNNNGMSEITIKINRLSTMFLCIIYAAPNFDKWKGKCNFV